MKNAAFSGRRRHFIASGLLVVGGSALANPTATAPAAATPTLLVVGDSLSAEYGLPRGTGWVALLEQRLAREAPAVRVVNASISGDTTSGGRTRLPALLRQHRPQIVVLELGANDALRGLPLAGTQDNLRAMVQAAQTAGAAVLLLGMHMPPNYGQRYAADFARLYTTVAQERQVPLLPFFLQGIADVPQAQRWFQADGIHPTAAAQPQLLDNVWPLLRPLLPRP